MWKCEKVWKCGKATYTHGKALNESLSVTVIVSWAGWCVLSNAYSQTERQWCVGRIIWYLDGPLDRGIFCLPPLIVCMAFYKQTFPKIMLTARFIVRNGAFEFEWFMSGINTLSAWSDASSMHWVTTTNHKAVSLCATFSGTQPHSFQNKTVY